MIKLLVNFTRKIVYLLCFQNSSHIYSGIIIPVNFIQENIVKVVSRKAVDGVTVYTIKLKFIIPMYLNHYLLLRLC